MKKIIKVIFFIIILLLVLTQIPIKKSVKVNFKHVKEQEKQIISNKDTKIICGRDQTTGPTWEIIGKDNIIFDGYEEQIILEGNKPSKMIINDIDDGNIDGNIYFFAGNFAREKEYGEDGDKYRAFKIKTWDIVYPISRGYMISHMVNKYYLVASDFGKWTFMILVIVAAIVITLKYKKSHKKA